MIRLERERKDEHGRPIRPSESWFERAERKRRQAEREGPNHEVTRLYADESVRAALEKLFHDKCVYCESRLGVNGSWDVEHYRPKGKGADRPGHSGYYWLAYTWENLYPACEYCNQNRKDAARWPNLPTLDAKGKYTSFPLEEGSVRSASPADDLGRERPLLLDPCDPNLDPEDFFRYNSLGHMEPRDPSEPRATATIEICHLDRRRLVDDRARVLAKARKIYRILRNAQALLDRDISEKDASDLKEIVELQQELLDIFLSASQPYAGLVRCLVREPEVFGLEPV